MKKSILKQMITCAYELKGKTRDTEIYFNIYSNSAYILDTEEDNIIDIVSTQEEAEEICNSPEMKGEVYYKPILINAFTGERITRKNFDKYKK